MRAPSRSRHCQTARVFRILRPSENELRGIAEQQRHENFTYDHVGATAGEPLPHGFHHVETSTVVGSGSEIFDDAAESLRNWGAHRNSGMSLVTTGPLRRGVVVIFSARMPLGGYVIAACRVVYIVNEPDEFAIAYGTLPLHPESGEERFAIRRVGDEVRFEISAFSKARHPLVRLSGPIARRVQARATNGYLEALLTRSTLSGDRSL